MRIHNAKVVSTSEPETGMVLTNCTVGQLCEVDSDSIWKSEWNKQGGGVLPNVESILVRFPAQWFRVPISMVDVHSITQTTRPVIDVLQLHRLLHNPAVFEPLPRVSVEWKNDQWHWIGMPCNLVVRNATIRGAKAYGEKLPGLPETMPDKSFIKLGHFRDGKFVNFQTSKPVGKVDYLFANAGQFTEYVK
jgi:hypothetical protein